MVIQNISCFQEPSRITSREEGKHNAAQAGIGEVTRRGGCMTLLSGCPLVPVSAKLSLFKFGLLYRLLQTAHGCESEYTRRSEVFSRFFPELEKLITSSIMSAIDALRCSVENCIDAILSKRVICTRLRFFFKLGGKFSSSCLSGSVSACFFLLK